MPLPALPEVPEIRRRLELIFPEGTPSRLYSTREMAARTVFSMLYVGTIEGLDRFLAPKQVYRMGHKQASLRDEPAREKYFVQSMKAGFRPFRDRWYADNSREPIRDETLRDGLVLNGAVVLKPGVPTTSGRGRYALQAGFAALFNPSLTGESLQGVIEAWQKKHLSAAALARITIVRHGGAAALQKVFVTLPGGDTRRMEAGPSSVITKAVIEVFAPRFLGNPAVVWISESGNKVVQRDDELAKAIGLKIHADKALPDVILADLAPDRPLLLFVEVVATDGPMTEQRRSVLLEMATDAGFDERNVLFVTAFADRSHPAFRKAVSNLAWGSFAWCSSEPDNIIAFDGAIPGASKPLSKFLAL